MRRAQYGQTLSISHHLVGKFLLLGEIWHFTQPFLRRNAIASTIPVLAHGFTDTSLMVIVVVAEFMRHSGSQSLSQVTATVNGT